MRDTGTRRYGVVLALVASSIVFQMIFEGESLVRWITLVLQALTFVAVMRAAAPPRDAVTASVWVAATVTLVSLVVLLVHGEIPETAAAIVSGLLVAVGPVVIGGGLLRDIRSEQLITTRTLAGVLTIYLLLGMFFAFVYGAIEAVDDGALFVQLQNATPADILYFSFTTMCTVGYGDLTLGGDVPRTFAVVEMLIGQIYLVTVVAVIVSNLGHRRQPT